MDADMQLTPFYIECDSYRHVLLNQSEHVSHSDFSTILFLFFVFVAIVEIQCGNVTMCLVLMCFFFIYY